MNPAALARNIESRTSLGLLAHHAEESHQKTSSWDWSDDLSHLPEARRFAWRRVLSSICTAEGVEETLMRPIQAGMAKDTEASLYLATHARDEERHHLLLKRYLRNTFDYEKRGRTVSDTLVYDTIFPRVAALFRRSPVLGLGLVHCYELFSLSFYAEIREKAQTDGAQNLLTLVRTIERDELRHLAGCATILKTEIAKRPLKFTDRLVLKSVLRLVQLDVSMQPWAVHNRELRGCLEQLGVDTVRLNRAAAEAVEETLTLC